jgi:hypothetical protein
LLFNIDFDSLQWIGKNMALASSLPLTLMYL